MTDRRLAELLERGQSPWLDQVRREWLTDGTLARWVDAGVRGVTSNPTIFADAIRTGHGYSDQIALLSAQGLDAATTYDRITLDDIRGACEVFADVYAATAGADGFVSHEVAPSLAHDTAETVREAHRLWAAIDRPNAMIKIPATEAGIPAVFECLADGINVNVTLMFTLGQYERVVEAYLSALETRADRGAGVDALNSVASFFVSRVDSVIDHVLSEQRAVVPEGGDAADHLRSLEGRAAVANATQAYSRMCARFSGERWARLEALGARRQRVLWASTSTKNPAYHDLKYVIDLVASGTVNTLPLATLEAFVDHGEVGAVLDGGTSDADRTVSELLALGIDVEQVGCALLDDGVAKFGASFDAALEAVAMQARQVMERA